MAPLPGLGSLSGNTTTAVTYKAPATVAAATTATVTAASVSSPSATAAHTIVVNPAPAVTSNGTLAVATVNTAYTATLTASGGTGALSWSLVSGSTLPAGLTLSGAGVLAGTPTAVGTSNFSVQVTDTSAAAPLSATAALSLVVKPPPLTLPAANPATLPAATTNTSYTGTIVASGGTAGYTWTVNGTAVPSSGSAVTLSSGLGLSVSNDGSATLSVSGTPNANGTVSFTAEVQDSTGATAGPLTYTVNAAPGFTVNGQVRLINVCGSNAAAGITVSINTTPVRTAITDANGNYAFTGVRNGSYTLTPSISGPSAAFSPAALAVTVNSDSDFNYFNVDLGSNVSGTVSYAGAKSGRVYLTLTNACGGSGGPGVSIAAPGAFTIRGVAPGTYSLTARLATQGTGQHENAADPAGTTSNIIVTSADVSGADVTLVDPAAVTPAAPTPQAIAEFNGGVIIGYTPSTDNNGIETATSYTLQWSTTAAFTTVAGSQTFPAAGSKTPIWLVNSATNSSLTAGSAFYFRALASAPGGVNSPYTGVFGPFTVAAPTTGDVVSGMVTFAGAASGPLYVVAYNTSNGQAYGDYVKTPVSPQLYSMQVPSGTYKTIVILDQNNNGVVDTGDLADLDSANVISVAGPTTDNLTLPSANSTATVTTQHDQNGPTSAQSLTSYGLTLEVDAGQKLPVAVELVSGPNVAAPMDLGRCPECDGGTFQYSLTLGSVVPQVGDSYRLKVTYSDSTSETLTAAVTALVSDLPANMTTTGTSTTPTFSWTDSSAASNYTYSFLLMDANGNTIWQIPGSGSASTGFSSAITSIAWGIDPTGNGSTPTVGSLTSGGNYQWQIQLRDSQGNTSAWLVPYQP